MKTASLLATLLLSAALLPSGCNSRRTNYEGLSIEGFHFGAHATVVGTGADTLWVSATAENVSDHQLFDEWDSCYRVNRLAIVAQGDSRFWDSKVWEIGRIPVYHDSTGRIMELACAGMGLRTTLPPGTSTSYELRVPVKQILGDSLAAGRYKINARIVINGRETKNLTAGEVVLRAPWARSAEESHPAIPATVHSPAAVTVSPPYIRGLITSREPMSVAVKDPSGHWRVVTFPRMLVVEDSSPSSPFLTSGARRGRVWLTFDSTTCIINPAGTRLPAESLTVGRRVGAWVGQTVLSSYPPQGGAIKVVVEDIGKVQLGIPAEACG